MDEKNSKEPAPGSRPRLLTQKPRRPSAKPSSYPSSNASNFQGSSQERSGTWRWPWSSLLPSSATRSPKFSTQQPTFLYRIRGTVGLLLAANLAMGGRRAPSFCLGSCLMPLAADNFALLKLREKLT
eukprot:TRINITY_DN8050_c0_g1_i2.p1 TRINITY_DN8050_c0_g1~~TRINITY_DN8050_c0_g1_i2.p1  ORF type:complete len:127 (+),score=2.28 TRINITY_DN8050_c0_g1_i2:145-525(+)